MSINNLNLDPFTKSTDGFEEEQDPEVELAFALQNAQPGDQRITDVLVERYAGELRQFIQAGLETYSSQVIPEDVIQDIIQRTITIAVNEVDQFWGKDSVRNWLYRLALKQVRKTLLRLSFPGYLTGLSTKSHVAGSHTTTFQDDEYDEYQQVFINLPRRGRLLLILRYLQRFSAKDIAQVLASEPHKIAKDLYKYRQSLLAICISAQQPLANNHRRFRQQINLAHDGLPQSIKESRIELMEHLEICPDCQAYANQLDKLEAIVAEICRQNWPLVEFEPSELDGFVDTINANLTQPSRLKILVQPVWKGAWLGLVLLILAVLGWVLIQASSEEDLVYQSPTSVPPQLPEPIDISSYSISNHEPQFIEEDTFISMQPSTSGNGRWMAFTISSLSSQEISFNNSADIYIYDRVNPSLQRLRFNDSGIDFFSWAYAPSMAYSEETTQSFDKNGGETTETGSPEASSGIFFFDRDNDQQVRIDLALDDQISSINNFYPTVSANGRFLAFWSNVSDQLTEDSPTCGEVSPRGICLDAIVIDRRTGELQRVPVGREIGQLGKNAYLSVTDDGNLLAFSIIITDKIASKLKISRPSEALIYDIAADYYTPVNISNDRTSGNGPSLLPRLSADGRYVAFTSLADNLVPEDTNQEADIFIRDLHTGTTELVPLVPQEPPDTKDSYQSDRYYGFWMDNISLSSNGRFVAVLSTLENLTHHYRLGCSPSPEGYCLSIFIHDRLTGETEQSNTFQLEDHDRVIDISDDGQFVTNFELFSSCITITQARVCAEVWQQDRNQPTANSPRYGYNASHYSRWLHDNFFDGQEGAANAFSITPDREILAVGTKQDTIHLWRIPERERFASLSSNSVSSIYSLDFSPDGEFLAAGSSNGTVHIWQVATSKEVYSLFGHPGRVIGLKFTPLGDFIIVGTPQQIWIWQKQDQAFVRTAVLDYPGNFVNDFALSPDGQWLAVAGEDTTTWIQHLRSQQVLLRLGGHNQEVTNVAFSPDGNYLASGDIEGKINLWQMDWGNDQTIDAEYQKTLIQRDWVRNLHFSEDGSILASSSFSGLLRLWRLPAGDLLESPPTGQFDFMPNGVFHFDGRILVAGSSSGLIHVWHSPENVSKPHFFIRSELDQLSSIPASPVDPIEDEETLNRFPLPLEQLFVNIREAGGTGLFDVQAPSNLPSRMTLNGARIGPGGIIVFQYEILDSTKLHPIAHIYISQHDELSPFLIGANAIIERSKVEGRDAEYVEGDWIRSLDNQDLQSQSGVINQWIWDPDYPARRLRWQEGNVIFAIHFKSNVDTHEDSQIVTRDDLIAIAESMAIIAHTSESEPLYANHHVQPGDTCASQAEQYGTTIKRITKPQPFNDGLCKRLLAINVVALLNNEHGYNDFRMEDQVMTKVPDLEAIWDMPW